MAKNGFQWSWKQHFSMNFDGKKVKYKRTKKGRSEKE